jgi:hypothetical protein
VKSNQERYTDFRSPGPLATFAAARASCECVCDGEYTNLPRHFQLLCRGRVEHDPEQGDARVATLRDDRKKKRPERRERKSTYF